MNFLKKCAAVLLTGAMVLSMSACSSDTDWIMRKGELEMPAGVYINNLLQSYYQASALVENTEEDVFKQQVEGTDAKEWIQQKALDETKRNMAACSEFNEHQLSFTQEELESCRQQAEAYYGQNGENLEKNGISQNSIELLYQIAYMKNKLFDALYAQGGEQEVSEEELRSYYEENYIKMAVQTFNFPEEPEIPEGATEEDKASYEEFYKTERGNVYTNANSFYLQAQIGMDAGQSWNEVLNTYKQQNAAAAGQEYDMNTNNYRLLDTATTPLNADIVGALKEAEQGELVKVETDTMIAIGATTDINEDPTDYEYVKTSILHALKDEAFEEYLLQQAQDESYELNQKAADRYQINKLKLS